MADAKGALQLHDLGLLCFDGQDSAAFLQGYLTTDANALDATPAFTAMCNIKGRAVLTGYAWRQEQRIMLLLHQTLCAVALDFLRPYLAFSKTRAAVMGGGVIGTIGLNLGFPALNLDDERQVLILEPSDGSASGFGKSANLLENAPPLPLDEWRQAAIDRREVWLEAATSGAFLPQMLALDELGAVSFTKGCYLGQEVVARAQHRGHVKRRLTRLEWSGAPVMVGAEVQDANGRGVGVVVAVAGQGVAAAAAEGHAGAALAIVAEGANPPLAAPNGATKFNKCATA